MWDNGGLNVLIPKRRGTGYLKCPLGHHVVKALSDVESDVGCDPRCHAIWVKGKSGWRRGLGRYSVGRG